MKFIHISDCHIGGWRESKLSELSLRGFREVIKTAISERVGFVLIAGDLFDTALPNIDLIKEVAFSLHELKEEDIPVYLIPGSHDFSPSGKTMLDVLERAGLVENVMKFKDSQLQFTQDRTGVKLTGMLGKKGGLELADYKELNKEALEKEPGFKIFLFHTLLRELKPKDYDMIEGGALGLLPKGFNYYAGGHPHFVYGKEHEGYGMIAYPGPLFPNNFGELEKLKHGGFYMVDVRNGIIHLQHRPILFYDVENLSIDVTGLSVTEAEKKLLDLTNENFLNKIVTLRVFGELATGKPYDIDFNKIMERFSGCYAILKNSSKLSTKEFEDIKVETGDVAEVEERIIQAHQDALKGFDMDVPKIKELITTLSLEKMEGETNADFESRLEKDVISFLTLEGVWNAD